MTLRVITVLIAIALCGYSWVFARRMLASWYRLPLDYALAMYTLTYVIGCLIIYLGQADYLLRFYGGTIPVPVRTSYALVLLAAALPYLIVPWVVVAFAGGQRQERIAAPRPPLRPEAVIGGILIMLAVSLVIIAPVAPMLLGNALNDLTTTASVFALYAQRQEVFETVAFIQGGVIYSVLPPIAAIVMFWPAKKPLVTRTIGGALALFATLLNLGMFQIGPTLAFLVVCVFCYFVLRHGRVNPVAIATMIAIGSLVLGLYSIVKASTSDVGQVESFLMRMPIPLPYLIQMAGEPSPGGSLVDLSFELGEYMFPQMRTAQSFVAMPQPAFVSAWFNIHFAAGIAVLVMIGGMIVIFGRLFAANGFGEEERDGRLILWAVVAAPTLYYAFQVDTWNLFTSAYSITFCIMPTLVILTLNAILPGQAVPRPASYQRRR